MCLCLGAAHKKYSERVSARGLLGAPLPSLTNPALGPTPSLESAVEFHAQTMLARLLGRWFDSALAILGRHPPLARRLLGALVAYLRLTPIRLGQRSLLAFCTRSLLPTLPPFDDAVVPLRACEAVRLRCFQLGGTLSTVAMLKMASTTLGIGPHQAMMAVSSFLL